MKRILLLSMMLVLAAGSSAWAALAAPGVLPDINGYEITLANNASFTPTMYFGGLGSAVPNTKGMNAEWIGPTGLPVSATSKTGATLVTTPTSSYAGTVGLYDTGGSGSAVGDFILAVSIAGPIASDFSINLAWNNRNGTAQSQTFTSSNFIYGAQAWRPGSTTGMALSLNDPTAAAYLMFVDLEAGAAVAGSNYVPVTYSLTGLYDTNVLAFNMYGYSPTGGNAYAGHPGISWTNGLTNGYTVHSTAAPVPIPPAVFLFGTGMSGLFFMRRKKFTA